MCYNKPLVNTFFILLVSLFVSNIAIGQGFKAAAVGGINISQIDGDGQAGYHKWGLTGGGRVSYNVYPKMDIAIEMLYSQRGSRKPDKVAPFIINLNYIEIPLLYSIHDWAAENGGYSKVRADLGFSYGYLFSSTQSVLGLETALQNLNKSDVSMIIGAGYQFNKHWAMSIRYTRSLFKMYKDEKLENKGLLGYYLTARAEYHF